MNPPKTAPDHANAREARQERRDRIRLGMEAIGIALIIAAAFLTWQQFVVLEQSVRTQIDDLHRSHRPWLTVDEIEVVRPLWFDSAGPHIEIAMTTRNSGDSPALSVMPTLQFRMESATRFWTNSAGYFDTLCSQSLHDRFRSDSNIPFGQVIPPNTTRRHVSRADGGSSFTGFQPGLSVVFNLFFVTCIDYRDEFGRPHATGFAAHYVSDSGSYDLLPKETIPGRFVNMGVSRAD